jgi:hypothetical protein
MIVAVAGRRIDAADAQAPRFPLARRSDVAKKIDAALCRLGASTVVSSAACGADLLALASARKLGVRRRIILPYQSGWFVADSVLDRPGRWKTLYNDLCGEAKATRNLVTLRKPRCTEKAFRAASDKIIEDALRLAKRESPKNPAAALSVLIVWEGAPRGADDMTAYMLDQMREAGAHVEQVLTLSQSGTR